MRRAVVLACLSLASCGDLAGHAIAGALVGLPITIGQIGQKDPLPTPPRPPASPLFRNHGGEKSWLPSQPIPAPGPAVRPARLWTT